MSLLPPGPRNRVISTLRYLRDPYGSLLKNGQRYGDPYTWPSFLGDVVVTADPAAVKALFSADPDGFLAMGADLLAPVLGESNLILLSGQRHRRMRALQTPPFHAAQLRHFGRLILDVAEEHVAKWPRARPFSMHRSMQEITLDVMLQVVFGLTDRSRRAVFKEAVLRLVKALAPSFMFMKALRRPFGGFSAWARFQRQAEVVKQLFQDVLSQRRAEPQPRQDVLSLLMEARFEDGAAFSDKELLETMLNLLGAGHETTASALAWTLAHVHRDRVVLERLTDELTRARPPDEGPLDPEAISRLPYLGAVCAETLRLTPVAPLIGRTLRDGCVVQGYTLPAGVSVGISILGVHRRPDLYPEPDRFLPERFLNREYAGFEYLPFGGGARRCLAAAFAQYEMKLVLAAVLTTHRLRLVNDAPVGAVVRNTTIGPRGGIEMRVVGSARN